MPKKIKPSHPSPRSRSDSRNGKVTPRSGRPRQRAEEDSAVIADSLFALKLKEKGACEVFFRSANSSRSRLQDFEVNKKDLFDQLHASYLHGLKLMRKNKRDFPPIEYTPDGTGLDVLIRRFESDVVPKHFYFNIEQNYLQHGGKKGYHFVLFRECDGWGQYWHNFHVRYVLKHLNDTYLKLHDLFVQFLKAFHIATQVDLWYGDTMGYCETWVEEEIENFKEQVEDPELALNETNKTDEDIFYKAHVEAQNEYRSGLAKHYERRITEGHRLTPQQLLRKVNALRKPHPFREVIRKGCEIIKEPFQIDHFNYIHDEDTDNGNPALRFENQVTILWDYHDMYTDKQIQDNDANANEGVYPPFLVIAMLPFTKSFDREKIKQAMAYPRKLELFMDYAAKATVPYEPDNKKSKR